MPSLLSRLEWLTLERVDFKQLIYKRVKFTLYINKGENFIINQKIKLILDA